MGLISNLQRDQQRYQDQVAEAQALKELEDRRSLFERGMDGLAAYFAKNPRREVPQVQAQQPPLTWGQERGLAEESLQVPVEQPRMYGR